jgi:hypothetical protein
VKDVVSLIKLRNDYRETRPVEKDQIRSVEKDQTRPVETDQTRPVPLIVVETPAPSTVRQPPPVRKNLSTLPPFRQPMPQADGAPDMLRQEIFAQGDEIFQNTSPVRFTSFAYFHALCVKWQDVKLATSQLFHMAGAHAAGRKVTSDQFACERVDAQNLEQRHGGWR